MHKLTRQQQTSLGGGRRASSLSPAATLGHLRLCMRRSNERWAIPTCLVAVLVLLLLGLKGDPTRFFSSLDRDAKFRNAVPETESEDTCSSTRLPPSWTVEASTLVDVAGGDIVPVRSVADPYPSLHSVVVDPDNNRVLMSDSNRGSLFFDDRLGGNSSSSVAEPVTQVRGPATGMMFVAGVALDPANREVFAVNNDISVRMVVFPCEPQGNVLVERGSFSAYLRGGVGWKSF